MTSTLTASFRPSLRVPSSAQGWTAALLGVTAVWGSTFVVVADAVAGLPVLAFLAYRFLAAALILLVVGRGVRGLDRAGLGWALVTGLVLWLGYLFQTFGLTLTTASKAGFLTGLFVVFTPLLAAVVLRRRASRSVWGSAAASTLGLLLLSGAGGAVSPLGDGLVLLCAVAFAAHILLSDRALERVPLLPFVTVQVLVCGVVSLVLGGFLGQLAVPRDPSTWGALALTAVLASAVGFLVQAQAQRRLPPARIAVVLACEPVFAAAAGAVVAGERLRPAGWLGAGIMLGAVLAVELVQPSLASRRRRASVGEGPAKVGGDGDAKDAVGRAAGGRAGPDRLLRRRPEPERVDGGGGGTGRHPGGGGNSTGGRSTGRAAGGRRGR
jgi:drug/metabolite transporter (DMT)-like permease